MPASSLAESYEVLEVVRRGGLSTTLRVRHLGTGDLRCIDVLRPAPGDREILERRLDAEARPLMELRHPHVVRVVDAAVGAAGEACIVREDQDGVTLRRMTGSRRPSVSLAVELLRQAADGLAFLHEHGRRVGGLSPEGLLVGHGEETLQGGAPRLVLGDLGLAKDWQEEATLTAAGLFVGRLKYTAPEQFEAGGRQSPPADVYALGLVAYELLTGKHPIVGDTASSLIAGHLFRPPVDFADSDPEGRVPEALAEIVLAALAKAPDDRPTAEAFRDRLAEVRGPLPAFEPGEIERWVGARRADSANATEPEHGSVENAPDTEQVPSEAHGISETTATHPMATSTSDLNSEDASRTVVLPSTPSKPDAAQLEAWLDEARSKAREEEFLDARDRVRKVLKVQPDHSMGLMLLASLEACLKIQVEESKAHQTVAHQARTVKPLEGGSQTVMLPTVPSAGGAPSPTGTETVQVPRERFQDLVAEATGSADGSPDASVDTQADASIDGEMPTQRLETVSGRTDVRPGADSPAGSQTPGAPASTERLDLPEDLDDGRTLPLKPEMMRRVNEAQPPGSAAPPARRAETARPAAADPNTGLADGTTQLLGATEAASESSEAAADELPGTVTMPMEQIEEQKRRALQRATSDPQESRGAAAETLPAIPSALSEPDPPPRENVASGEVLATQPVLPTQTAAPTQAAVPIQAEAQPAVQKPEDDAPPAGHPRSFADPGPAPDQTPPAGTPQTPFPQTSPPQTSPPQASAPQASLSQGREPADPASVDELGFGGGAASAFPEHGPGRRSRRRRKRRGGRRGDPSRRGGGTGVMIGAVIAALLVFAIGYAVAAGIDLRQLVGLGETEQIVPPSELPPIAAVPGLLLLDAAPWAEIVQITDSFGEEVPLRFRHTPALYELAPGSYTVVLEDGDGDRETLDVEVVSEQTTSVRPEFSDLRVDDYFRLMGWR